MHKQTINLSMKTGGLIMVRFSAGILFGAALGMSVVLLDKKMMKQAKRTVRGVMKSMCM